MNGKHLPRTKDLVAAILLSIFFLGVTPSLARTQTLSGRIKWFGSTYLNQTTRGGIFPAHQAGEFLLQRLELHIRLEGDVSDRVHYFIRTDLLSQTNTGPLLGRFPESDFLGAPVSTESVTTTVYEAYVQVTDFLLQGMDLTIGKQRISWGTADKVSIVDNLNPIDFTNFFTFDPDWFYRRRPRMAIRLDYQSAGAMQFQIALFPSRAHAPLPVRFSELVSTTVGPAYLDETPFRIQNLEWGLRWSTVVLGWDFGLTWYHGRYDLPVWAGPVPMADGTLAARFLYPRRDVFGLDFSGERWSIGWWGEIAYERPESVSVTLPVDPSTAAVPGSSLDLFDDGMWKFVFGADTTLNFGNGVYINLQFVHGLFDERNYTPEAERIFGLRKGMFFGETENYLIGRVEYEFIPGVFKVKIGSMAEFTGDHTTAIVFPETEWRIADRLTLQAGAALPVGDREGTKFAVFRDEKIAYILAKMDF